MQSNEIRTLCARILWLQNRGEHAFRFQAVLPNHLRKKWTRKQRTRKNPPDPTLSSSGNEEEFSNFASESESEAEEQEERSEQDEAEVEEEITSKEKGKGKLPESTRHRAVQ
jgi:hypothetical protein